MHTPGGGAPALTRAFRFRFCRRGIHGALRPQRSGHGRKGGEGRRRGERSDSEEEHGGLMGGGSSRGIPLRPRGATRCSRKACNDVPAFSRRSNSIVPARGRRGRCNETRGMRARIAGLFPWEDSVIIIAALSSRGITDIFIRPEKAPTSLPPPLSPLPPRGRSELSHIKSQKKRPGYPAYPSRLGCGAIGGLETDRRSLSVSRRTDSL